MDKQFYHNVADKLARMAPTLHEKLTRQTRLPIPPNHFITMVHLLNHPAQTITEICSLLSISKQQMSPIIDKLERSQYISREINPLDRRSFRVSLTSAGEKLMQDHYNIIVDLFERSLSQFSDDDIIEMERCAGKLLELFQKL